MTLERWSWIASIVAGGLAIIGFPVVVWQLHVGRKQRRDAVRLSTSQVLLAADGVLTAHASVHEKLRRGGDWYGSEDHPTTEELPSVEPYMGVFERIFIAVAAGQVEDEVVDQLYGYRLANIWHNKKLVRVKLEHDQRKLQWKRLIALTYVVEAYRGERLNGHKDNYFPSGLFGRRHARRVRKRLREKHLGKNPDRNQS
jgi:hypothetical protein